MRIHRFFLLLLITAFASAGLRGQSEGAVHGEVIAEADGSRLTDAEISLLDAGGQLVQTIRPEDGHFVFQNVRPGEYMLVARHENFLERRIAVSLRPREVKNLVMALALRPLTEAVEVKGHPTVAASTHSPSSTLLIPHRIESMPVAQRNGIADFISSVAPGIVRGHDDFVHVRGQEIALNTSINGVSFWENPHSLFSAGMSPSVLQSANVMMGGFSAEYGNRFGGILDIVTKSGASMNNEGFLTLGAGTALRHNAALEYGGHTDRLAYFLSASLFESARFLSPPEERSIHNTGRGAHNFLQFDINAGAADFFKVVLMGSGVNLQIPKTELDDQMRPAAEATQQNREQTLIFSWNHLLSPKAVLSTSFYERWSRSELRPGLDRLAANAQLKRNLVTTGVKTDLTKFLKRHAVKGGIDAVLLRLNERFFYDPAGFIRLMHHLGLPHTHLTGSFSLSQEESGGQVSAYLQDSFQVTDRLTLDSGLRYDQYGLIISDFQFSPRLNVSYRVPAIETTLHASYNHLFSPPPVENVLIGSAGFTERIREIGRSLGPVRSVTGDQFEAGATHRFPVGIQAGLAGYYRKGDNPVHTVIFPDSRIYAYANFDREKAFGMELKVDVEDLKLSGLDGYFNYAWGRVYFYGPVTGGFIADAHHGTEATRFLAPMDQAHTLNAGFTYRHRGSGLWLGMTFEYGSGTPIESDSHETGAAHEIMRVPSHFLQNVILGWDVRAWGGEEPRLSLQLNVENIGNKVYKIAQESVFSPSQYSIPRLFSGSLKIRF